MIGDESLRDAALLLVGHGSTLNADSSAPTYQHAEEIRRRKLFAEVHVAFWKEEPNFRQALRQTNRQQVYVVPNFISSGYFTEQIIPRELGLTEPVTHTEAQDIFYCAPVGLHASMTEALLQRAKQVVEKSDEAIPEPAKTACLFICGHGTSFNDNSTKIIQEQAAAIRSRGLYADCQPVLMEQAPFVKDWRTLTNCPDVIVVPFFISDGLHSYEDIPVLLGLTHNIREKGFTNPHQEERRRLWYATAIGTEAFLADVILAQVKQFQAQYPESSATPRKPAQSSAIRDELAAFMERVAPPWKIGEVAVRPGFELSHRDDLETDPASLREIESIEEWRELIRTDRAGIFRPLRAAPNLRRGWIYHTRDLEGVQLALGYLYPAELANWSLRQHGKLPVTPWIETAERQSGRFRVVREIDPAGIDELAGQYCQAGCLKQRLWHPAAQEAAPATNEIPLLCPEACNFLIGKAREMLKGVDEDLG
jgi:sirohydrochlorin cobaltochelatase